MDNTLLKTVQATAEIYGKEMSQVAAEVFLSDLAEYPAHVILTSLSRCRKELRYFPTLADIIARIDDGRPGPEEAWAMIPQDEYGSVVWNEEMQGAYSAVRHIIESDPVGARLAFKETYTRIVADARMERRPCRWSPSLGFDKHARVAALLEAVNKNRIELEYAKEHAPELEYQGQKQVGLKQLGFSGLKKLQDFSKLVSHAERSQPREPEETV